MNINATKVIVYVSTLMASAFLLDAAVTSESKSLLMFLTIIVPATFFYFGSAYMLIMTVIDIADSDIHDDPSE